MQIIIVSVLTHDGHVRCRARATAQDAKIILEVTYAAHPEASDGELWQQARDEVLRYLDIA